MDRLAREGVLFENTIAESSWTLPTHASLFTGLTSRIHGVWGDRVRLDNSCVTLAEIFKAAGYRTKGLWSGPYLHPVYGFDQGFEEGDYEGFMDRTYFDNPDFEFDHPAYQEARKKATDKAHLSVTSPWIADKAIAFLEENREKPFFLFLHFFDVHLFYIPPESIWRRFDPDYTYEKGKTAKDFFFTRPIREGMDPRDLEHVLALYDGEIFFTDKHLGRLLNALTELGLEQKTLVVVTSDHGDEFLEHGGAGHRRTLYDEVIKVPLIYSLPGTIEGGRRVTAQVRHIDIMPTILGFIGLPIPTDILGKDLGDLLRGGSGPTPDLEAVARLGPGQGRQYTLRNNRYKLVVRRNPKENREEFELFNLFEDPGEQRPLTGPEANQKKREAMSLLSTIQEHENRLKARMTSSGNNQIDLPPELQKSLKELGYIQ
jgi:arylsulfatase A-like enzyme